MLPHDIVLPNTSCITRRSTMVLHVVIVARGESLSQLYFCHCYAMRSHCILLTLLNNTARIGIGIGVGRGAIFVAPWGPGRSTYIGKNS